jgi:hypothetical protein
MDRNIAQLQGEFSTAMKENVALQAAFGGTRADLIKDISETREIVAANSAKLDDIKSDIGGLQSQIAAMRSGNRDHHDFMIKKGPGGPQ